MDTQIIFNDETVHPETTTDLILHGNSNVKDVLDNFRAVPMSDFGKKLADAASLAEVCRLIHQNYTFAKDSVDNVEWKIVGNPSIDNDQLHVSNSKYIWRTLKLGAYTFDVDFDINCNDSNKIIFQLFDNTALPTSGYAYGTYRHWYRLLISSDGYLQFKYIYQVSTYNNGYTWGATTQSLTKTFDYKVADAYHITLRFDKSDSTAGLKVNGGSWNWTDANSVPVSNKSWRVYLGYSADALIDNFVLTNDSTVVSKLDFT